ncbi:MAG: isoprenylcysteine carboxylmethyltransferase family protein [Planctomycetota bacterium]
MKETAYLLQATLVTLWWVGLFSSPRFFAAFQFGGISPIAFWSLLLPDVLLIAALSAVRAYRKDRVTKYVILGAFAYATLYCCNACVLTHSGWLSVSLMLAGLAYNAFLCFNASLFRTSSAGPLANTAKTLVQVICIWSITLGILPGIILNAFGVDPVPPWGISLALASLLFVACSALGLLSAFFMVRHGHGTPLPMDQTNRLVVAGPYRYVRNPMAIAGIGQGMALAIAYQSPSLWVYSLTGAVVWHVAVRPFEERNLLDRFGKPYRDYRKSVRCWIPTSARQKKS